MPPLLHLVVVYRHRPPAHNNISCDGSGVTFDLYKWLFVKNQLVHHEHWRFHCAVHQPYLQHTVPYKSFLFANATHGNWWQMVGNCIIEEQSNKCYSCKNSMLNFQIQFWKRIFFFLTFTLIGHLYSATIMFADILQNPSWAHSLILTRYVI